MSLHAMVGRSLILLTSAFNLFGYWTRRCEDGFEGLCVHKLIYHNDRWSANLNQKQALKQTVAGIVCIVYSIFVQEWGPGVSLPSCSQPDIHDQTLAHLLYQGQEAPWVQHYLWNVAWSSLSLSPWGGLCLQHKLDQHLHPAVGE